jgi:hypothetical protein
MLFKRLVPRDGLSDSHRFIICGSKFGQQIRNTWKVFKCGAEEGWRRSVGPIM